MAIRSFDAALAAALTLVFAVWIKRVFWMARFRKAHPPLVPLEKAPASLPKLSVIIPARNEEKNIGHCLELLSAQDYPSFEIIVVNDRSTDKTHKIVLAFRDACRVPLKLIDIEKLPPGWTGKNHAVHAGSKAASGEWLLFTDADTSHFPASLSTSVDCALKKNIDLLTLAPETESRSFWEKTVQPLAVGSLALWFDPIKVNDPQSGVTLANGQFILIRREHYEKIGGNEAVKSEVVEDVAFAKLARAAGLSVGFLDGTRLYATRMYSSLREIRGGWTRIFTHLFEKKLGAILHKVFLFLFFSIFPFAVAALEGIFRLTESPLFRKEVFVLALAVSGWIVLVRFIGNLRVKSDPWFAFLHPLGSLVMVWILLECVGRVVLKQPSAWRGDLHQ